jgi:hypothetical protein
MKKKQLVIRMTMLLGFLNGEVMNKTMPQLLQLIRKKLIEDEKILVEKFEKEVEGIISVVVPEEISNLIYQKKKKKEKENENENENEDCEIQEPPTKRLRIHFVNLNQKE